MRPSSKLDDKVQNSLHSNNALQSKLKIAGSIEFKIIYTKQISSRCFGLSQNYFLFAYAKRKSPLVKFIIYTLRKRKRPNRFYIFEIHILVLLKDLFV